jgi:hypothetical protein
VFVSVTQKTIYLEAAMNTYFMQVEKRSQWSSYLLAAFALITMLMLILSFSRFFEQRGSLPFTSSGVVLTESSSVPVAIPAPLPPTEQVQIATATLPTVNANSVPQAVANPVPSVP